GYRPALGVDHEYRAHLGRHSEDLYIRGPRGTAGRVTLAVDEFQFAGSGDGLVALAGIKLAVDRSNLRLDGVGRHEQLGGDFRGSHMSREQRQQAQLGQRGLEPLTPCWQSTPRLSATVVHLGLRPERAGQDRSAPAPVVVNL